MSVFSDRLIQIRTNANVTQQNIADKLGVTRSAYGAWEKGRNEPSFEALCVLCNEFRVSADYLLGLTDVPASKPVRVGLLSKTVQRDRIASLPDPVRERVERFMMFELDEFERQHHQQEA